MAIDLPERRMAIAAGTWSAAAKRVLEERYLWRNEAGELIEDPDGMCWRVARAVAAAEAKWGVDGEVIAEQFADMMIDRKFMPNSPTLMNAGKGNGLQLSACFVLPVDDSMEGIFESIKHAAIIHKSGGGTGFAFSRLRPEGASVASTHGAASGPISFLKVFNEATEAVKQGGTRRGANMGILRVDHPDILRFIDCKRTGGITNFNISVAATDKFFQAVMHDTEYELVNPQTGEVTGRLNARAVFDRIAEAAWATGDPGFIFIDRINSSPANPTPEVYPIEATNPCVTAETLIYTDRGLERAGDLVADGRPVRVALAAGGFAQASHVFATGRKSVVRLTTAEGYEIRLTEDHRVMTTRGWVAAAELKSGDQIRLLSNKGGFGQGGSLALGRLLGWLVGDGTLTADRAVLSFFGDEKRELAPAFAEMMAEVVPVGTGARKHYAIQPEMIANRDEARVRSARFWRIAAEHGLRPGDKHKVPETIFTGAEDMQRGFLQALFTADGHVSGEIDKGVSVRLTSINRPMLVDTQRLLLNFGVASRIYTDRRAGGLRSLPDGHGGIADYATKPYHDLVIAKDNLHRFAREVGFLSEAKQSILVNRLDQYDRGPYRESFTARFEALVADGEEMVYDLTEPMTHSFVANGLMVHNCGEQPLAPYEACNLGSVNLARFVVERGGRKEMDWRELDRVCRLSIRFLDDVIEVNPYPLPQIHEMVKANRRVGLGVMGWADLLFMLGIPYNSRAALELGQEIMERINIAAHAATEDLAEERGPFPNWHRSIYRDGKPMRNSTVTTIAPTGTISIIADCSSGIEPIFALAFVHKSGDRLLKFVNPHLESVARQRGFYSDELMQDVLFHGAVHGVKGVPADVQDVFVTAHEIQPEWHVRMQAAFQKHTDNAVSKTINLPNNATVEDVRQAYLLSYELGCLGITVFRDGSKGEQVLNVGIGGGDKKPEAAAPAAPVMEPVIKDRPSVVFGYTTQIVAPEGKVNVTLNSDEEGLLEVFINIGKAGSDLAAMAEALGRLISLNLRLPSPMTQDERVREIIHQLQGIGGSRTVGFGQMQLRSLPDALAKVLERHITENPLPGKAKAAAEAAQPPLPGLLHTGNLCPKCGCSTLVHEEGCKKCYSCGHSEC